MLRALVISPDEDMNQLLEEVMFRVGIVGVVRTLRHYPDKLQILRVARACDPDIIFVNADDLPSAEVTETIVNTALLGFPMVAISRTGEPQVLLELMRLGIRECLCLPFEFHLFHETIMRLKERLKKAPPPIASTDLLFSFLPAKPGAGASTIALNTAVALSRLPEVNVLLADLDLNAGMIQFMLKLNNPHSIIDAAKHAATIDENIWPDLVTSFDRLDVLHAGKLDPGERIEFSQIHEVLRFARRHYRAICIDLSGHMEKYSVEIMKQSKRVFIICTSELPSLHLAREKMVYLRSLDLKDRTSILLNRCQKRGGIAPADIEQLVGQPVYMTFPNDYSGFQQALSASRHVAKDSKLGSQFERLAESLIHNKTKPMGRGLRDEGCRSASARIDQVDTAPHLPLPWRYPAQ